MKKTETDSRPVTRAAPVVPLKPEPSIPADWHDTMTPGQIIALAKTIGEGNPVEVIRNELARRAAG